jgi:S-adenosylmethionine:tRNA ribosyltransferase-isomerase
MKPMERLSTADQWMDVSDFDFHLPDELIAQEPPAARGGSRLLILNRRTGSLTHSLFTELPAYLRRGDLLVRNNTRVFPARLLGHRVPSGGAVECLLLATIDEERRPSDSHDVTPAEAHWDALVHPGQKLKPGARMRFERDGFTLHGEVLERRYFGRRRVRLWTDDHRAVADVVDRIGHIPLPPYIRRDDGELDRERYQTVYAREPGSIAAPTAGLHFTPAVFDALAAMQVEVAEVTLHVGYGTFKPVRVDRVEQHVVDPEHFSVSLQAAEALTRAKREGRRIIAVGTTTTRTLESLEITPAGEVVPASGATSAFIYPGHRFRLIDGLVTNFHLPKSSLLMLVAALTGRDQILAAYRAAVEHRYRFYSYGDAMLIV